MPYLAARDPFADAKDTLSSWDKCMAKSYCKWPVIVAIVVGSLIILSVVLCIARCICCGAECACCCFKCCSCCCPSGRSKHKRMKSDSTPGPYPSAYQPPIPPPAIDTRPVNQQYRSHAAPAFNPAPQPEAPQYARFETSKPVNEDALPAMPTWGDASSVHVEETVMPEKKGDVEMDRLNHNGSVTNASVSGVAAVGTARRSPGPSPIQRSPTNDPYGFPAGYHNDSFVAGGPQRGPRNSPGPYGDQYEQAQDPYRDISPIQPQPSLSPIYGAGAGYGQNQQYGRHSPNQAAYNQQYGQPAPRHNPSPPQVDGYGYGAPPTHRNYDEAPYHENNYAPPAPVRTQSPQYAPSGPERYQSPAPAYPGQQTYGSPESAYPGQQTYQAFQPTQGEQHSGVTRRPVDGSWKEI